MEPIRYSTEPLTVYRPPRAPARAPRKSFVRRAGDNVQTIRLAVQLGFLLLNLWIGARFYLFVRYYETAGQTVKIARPPGVEGWLPIAALMNLKYMLVTGTVPWLHPAGMFLLIAFLAISFLLRKAFCSWLCPIGTLSEWLWQGGRELFGRNFVPPKWIDIPLRGLKYLLLGLFLYVVVRMTAADILAFLSSPYGVVADVKMLDFFRHLGTTAATVIAVLVVLSVLVKNAWCRYLCPYGALMGLVSFFSPTRIRRDPAACIDCAKCAKACPSMLKVDKLVTVRSLECNACLSCVSACPVEGALSFSAGAGRARSRAVPGWAVAALILLIFGGIVGWARVTGHWQSGIPERQYFELVPGAAGYEHPAY